MFRTDFPDLAFIQQRSRRKIDLKLAHQPFDPRTDGWPHCVLNVTASEVWRPRIYGPLSLFINLKGHSHCRVEQRRVLIENDRYLLSPANTFFDLEIENSRQTETLNIHFAEGFAEQVWLAYTLPGQRLLDAGEISLSQLFTDSLTVARSPAFDGLILNLRQEMQAGPVDKLREEELMTQLMLHLLESHFQLRQTIQRLPAQKMGTREALYKRLNYSLDYLHSHYAEAIDLEQLASVAALSKYHYLRAFKALYQQTPYQYLVQLRIRKASHLLKKTKQPVTWIAFESGFENVSVFNRRFRQLVGATPLAYRQA